MPVVKVIASLAVCLSVCRLCHSYPQRNNIGEALYLGLLVNLVGTFVCQLWWGKTADILHEEIRTFMWFVCVMETDRVLCVVRT